MTATLEAPAGTNFVNFDGDKDKPKLDATFRCDSCGAQAYVMVTFRSSDLQLLFCSHHANKHREAMLPLLSEWYSETSRLDEDRKKGSEN